MSRFDEFLRDIDRQWARASAEKIRLRIIGSAALMLQTEYDRGTKDSDVWKTIELPDETQERLTTLAGRGTALHTRHKVYLEFVPNGLPFLPHPPAFHALNTLNASLEYFEILALDVVDVVVSKLKRFNANDDADVRAMIEGGHVDHPRFIKQFLSAVDRWDGAEAADLPKYIENLHRVERDYFGVAETDVDLPNWVFNM